MQACYFHFQGQNWQVYENCKTLTLKALNVKYFSWWLGTASLALSRDRQSKTISGLFLGTRNQAAYGDMINRLRERQALITHPLLFPLIICEKMAKEHSHAINAATRQVFGLEQSVGVHDYGTDLGERLAIVTVVSSLDVDTVTRKLNGELSRLANYEKWVNSHTVMLDSFFDSIQEEIRELKPLENQVLVRVRDMCAFLRGWNVDMAARIACQQKIVSGLIQTVRTLYFLVSKPFFRTTNILTARPRSITC